MTGNRFPNQQPQRMHMKSLKFLVAAAALACGAAQAGTVTGLIATFDSSSTGAITVTMNVAGTLAACATSGKLTVDGTSTVGKVHAQALTTAFVMQKTITLTGTGACSGTAELISSTSQVSQ